MYSMYPEWGPARHRPDETEQMATPTRRPRYWERDLVGASVGARDTDGELPDDN
jgi:hypothetical protein